MRIATTIAVACLSVVGLAAAGDAQAVMRHYELHIPQQSLDTALRDLAQQTGLQIALFSDTIDGNAVVGPVAGMQSAEQALKTLLAPSGLSFKVVSEGTIAVLNPKDTPANHGPAGSEKKKSFWGRLRISQAETAASPASSARQGPDEGGLKIEEIVVTAQKRTERLQDVPISIGLASARQLQERHINGLDDLPNMIPNFNFGVSGQSKDISLNIRGVGTVTFSNAVEPSVGTVVDGVVLGRQGPNWLDFSDIERVEVLRGPQGTLFGMNTSAGILNIVTKSPTEEVTGGFGMEYGSYDRVKVNGAISGGLSPGKLLGRLSFYSTQQDAMVENVFENREFAGNSQEGIRGKLLFTPRDQTRLTLNLDWGHRDGPGGFPTIRSPGSPFSQSLLGSIAGEGNTDVNGPGEVEARDEIRGGSLQWDEQFGDYALTSISAYRTWDLRIRNDTNYSPVNFVGGTDYDSDQHQFTQELRLASPTDRKVDWIAGLFYFDQSLEATTEFKVDFGQFVTPGAPFAQTHSGLYDEDVATRSFAAFGEANLHVTDALTLFVGTRWTREKVDTDTLSRPRPGFVVFFPPAGRVVDSIEENNWSGRAGARWNFAADDMLYGTVTRGYKGPGFNTISSTGTAEPVGPEIPTSYELGWKSMFWEDRLRTSLAAFYTSFKDFQANSRLCPGGSTICLQTLQNAGDLETQGVEFELEGAFAPFSINLAGAYTDATFKEYDGAACYSGQTPAQGCVGGVQDLAGGRLVNAPKWSFNANVRYDVVVPGRSFNGFVRMDYSWRDDVQWQNDQNPATIEDAYGLLGASLGIEDKAGRYTFTVYAKNLTDDVHGQVQYIANGLWAGLYQVLPRDFRRIYGASFAYRF